MTNTVEAVLEFRGADLERFEDGPAVVQAT